MFQTHRPALRSLTTAHLAQTMTLLTLTSAELRQQIDQELASNPALELVEERRCPTCHRLIASGGVCAVCSRPTLDTDEPIVFISPRDVYAGGEGTMGGVEAPEDDAAVTVDELPAYVLRQIAPDLEEGDRALAAHLLMNLDEDGLLSCTLSEMARFLHVLPSRLQAVQRLIQHADPIGVGSSSVEEALLVQLETLADDCPDPDLAERAIRQGMALLSRKQYAELARLLDVSVGQVRAVARFIGENLNPRPACAAWGEATSSTSARPSAAQVYYQPDMIISRLNDRAESETLVVEVIMPLAGTLRVNPLYKEAIHEAEQDCWDGLRKDMDRASLFVKCIQQRNHTILRLMQRVVSLQHDFILMGDRYLRPITRASLAIELDVHESTISRAVANKAVQIPNGRIIPLSSFFDRSRSIRTVLCDIIAEEARPMSDSELSSKLAERGYRVARRTVAKYRSMEGILPSGLRQS